MICDQISCRLEQAEEAATRATTSSVEAKGPDRNRLSHRRRIMARLLSCGILIRFRRRDLLQHQQPIGSGMQPCACGGVPDAGALAPACGGGGGGGGGGNALITGAVAGMSVGFGSASVSVRSPFCSVAVRRSIDCKIQPLWPSPVRSRTVSRVVVSMNTATPSFSPATVPTRVKFGCCGSAGGGGAGRGAATGTVATTGAGGRRDGVNSGRVRVAVSALSGIDQSGLAATVGASAGFAVTSGGGMA